MRKLRLAGLAVAACASITVLGACAGTGGSAAGASGSGQSTAPDAATSAGTAGGANGGGDNGGANGAGGNNGGGGTHGGGSPSAHPSPSASASRPPKNLPTENYSVVSLHDCGFEVNQVGDLILAGEFRINYFGRLLIEPVPFVLTNNTDTYSTTGSHSNGQGFRVVMGGQKFSASGYPGKKVTLTMRINPTTPDNNPADNVVTVTINVPDTMPPADLLEPLPC
jgi:hypothetical protein